jgi:hypothetical protein
LAVADFVIEQSLSASRRAVADEAIKGTGSVVARSFTDTVLQHGKGAAISTGTLTVVEVAVSDVAGTVTVGV